MKCIRCFVILGSILCFLAAAPLLKAEEIIIVATSFQDESAETIAEEAPTSFIETVKVKPLAYGLTDTLDALRLVADVDLPDYGGATPAPLTLRGSNSQQTLVMLDGIPLTLTPFTGNITDLSLYTIPGIDKIEIVKGSNSAAFGSSAMGGAVNIVTKKPSLDNSAELTSSLGSYGYNLHNLLLNAGRWGQGFMLNITRSGADNDFRYEREDGSTVRRENNDVTTTTLLSKAWLDLGGWDTVISGNIADQSAGFPGSEGSGGAYLTPDDTVDISQYAFSLSTSRNFGPDSSFSFKASRLHNRTHNYYNNMFSQGNFWTRLTSDYIDASYSRRIGALELRPGFVLQRDRVKSDEYGLHKRTVTSGVLGSTLDIKPVLLSLTLRYDESSDFDSEWLYHTGILWRAMPHLSIRANYGNGYHQPTIGQLYAPYVVPNPNLKPEKSVGWDIGPVLEYKRFGAGVSFFLTRYEDKLKTESPMPNVTWFNNIDRARSTGVDAFAWVKPVDVLRISAGYAHNRATYESGIHEGNQIKHVPKSAFSIRADCLPVIRGRQADVFVAYRFRKGVYANEANTVKTGNRNLLDAGLSLEIFKNATLAFKVINIFDDTSIEYKDDYGYAAFWYPVPGRTYRGSVQLSF